MKPIDKIKDLYYNLPIKIHFMFRVKHTFSRLRENISSTVLNVVCKAGMYGLGVRVFERSSSVNKGTWEVMKYGK